MPRRSGDLGPPASYVEGEFIGGKLASGAPVGVAEAQALAHNLQSALEGSELSISALARRSGVDRTVIYDLLAGNAYASALTLARLERALERRLWPDL